MSKTFRAYSMDQMLLLPPNMREWLPEGHLALFVSDVVDALDLSALMKRVAKDETRGGAAYHPLMLVKLIIYGYCVGIPSSRRIERATYEDVAFRVLSGDQHPDHDTVADFRRRVLPELCALFVQVLAMCQKAGLVKLGHVALDGTKIKANASKHKAMSYERMLLAEKRLQEEVKKLLADAERADAEEDARFGKGKRGDELPDELARRQSRLEKIQQAKAALEQEARDKAAKVAAEAQRKNEEKKGKAGRKHEVPSVDEAEPEGTAQKNFTDPESRIMLDGASKSFEQAYNAQAAVDSHCQVIVAAEVTQNPNDKHELVPMLEVVQADAGALPACASADSGYFSEAAINEASDLGVELYVPPDRHKHNEPLPQPKGDKDSAANRMRDKLRSEEGHDIYRMRKAIVEPVFGQIKQARGFRMFSLRGLDHVRAEWKLVCMAHNVLKLFRNAPAGYRPCTA
jgi:transposase